MTDYTVVGLWIDDEPPCRIAAWVVANDPIEAVTRARDGDWVGGTVEVGELLLAGVFEGHLSAVDEQ